MKTILLGLALAVIASCSSSYNYPDHIKIDGGKFHVQGIAYDTKEDCMYCSFTSTFYKTDTLGNIIGSVDGINGHLGAMTFHKESRKVYASLECKDDVIGKSISDKLGKESYSRDESKFYIAEIDVDKITGMNMKFEDVITLHDIKEAAEDYLAKVVVDGQEIDHRYACSGIDGVTIAPAFGPKESKEQYLYVAYGVYGDVDRIDNEYNVLLCYKLDDITEPIHKYFVKTGNTTWGVQNLAYDSYTNKMFLAVYKGKKPQHPNYTLFAVDMAQVPFMAELEGVPYHEGEVEQVAVCGGWHFKWGSTGLCPMGDGYYYISEKTKVDGRQVCNAKLFKSGDFAVCPFERPWDEESK
jgi:hypothetical protein